MIQKLIFAAVLGAVIGYITNWLAIKMLFRPYYEKRIFGIKVPFTPGLIPKEKNRIAKSVGDAIGNHLLTSDTMVEALRNNGVNKKLKVWVEKSVLEIEQSSISIGDQIKKVVGHKYEKLVMFIKTKINNLVLSLLRKDTFKKEIEEVIIDSLRKELAKSPKALLEQEFYNKFRDKLLTQAKNYKNSKEFNKVLCDILNGKIKEMDNCDKALWEVIPAGLVSTAKVYIYNKNYDIAMTIKGMFEDDRIKYKIKDAITNMVSSNLSPMIAMFLSADIIYEKVVSTIQGQLDDEDNQKNIALFINDLLDKALEKKVSDVFANISEDAREDNVKQLSEIAASKIIDDRVLDMVIESFENKVNHSENISELLNKMDCDYEVSIRNYIKNKLNELSQDQKLEEKITVYISDFVDKFLGKTVKELSSKNEKNISEVLSNGAEEMFDRFIVIKGADIIDAFNIKKIVEDKINSFEVSFAEEIILEIASKELSAITWLGALLGGIMGLLSTFIASM